MQLVGPAARDLRLLATKILRQTDRPRPRRA
jgi:hypothetical protein